MKRNNVIKVLKNVFYVFAALIQISLITVVFVLNYLTVKKAGVMRHIYSRILQYEQTIFSHSNLIKYSFISIVLGIIFIILIFNAIKKGKGRFVKFHMVLGALMSFMLVVVINSDLFINMLAYPYFIIAFSLSLMIEVIVNLFAFINH